MARIIEADRRRDRERTRAEILDVATEHFAEHGYSGARVDEIAEQTRTTKRMLYYYFGPKEASTRRCSSARTRRSAPPSRRSTSSTWSRSPRSAGSRS